MTVAKALKQARTSRKRSQEYMALEMEVARRTVQNWEKGITEPNIGQAMLWFQILEVSPLPFLFQYVYPKLDELSGKDDDERIKEALLTLLNDLPAEGIRQLLYLFYGNHGSEPRSVMNMVTAHLQTPMEDRLIQGKVITTNYLRAKKNKTLIHPENIQPDVGVLMDTISRLEKNYLEEDA